MTNIDITTLRISARLAGSTALGMDLDGGSTLASCVERGPYGDCGWERRDVLDAIALEAGLGVGDLREHESAEALLASFAEGYGAEAALAERSAATIDEAE